MGTSHIWEYRMYRTEVRRGIGYAGRYIQIRMDLSIRMKAASGLIGQGADGRRLISRVARRRIDPLYAVLYIYIYI